MNAAPSPSPSSSSSSRSLRVLKEDLPCFLSLFRDTFSLRSHCTARSLPSGRKMIGLELLNLALLDETSECVCGARDGTARRGAALISAGRMTSASVIVAPSHSLSDHRNLPAGFRSRVFDICLCLTRRFGKVDVEFSNVEIRCAAPNDSMNPNDSVHLPNRSRC